MKYLLFTLSLFVTTFIQAQYSSPSDVSYDQNTETYYISEQGTGKITTLKGTTNTTLISGLKKPTAVVFGNLANGSGLLVADSNVIKAYLTNGNLLTTISIPGAQELSDITGDLKTGAMYVSDISRNYIYKITFGGPPFYLPTVTNYITSGLNRPSSIYFDSGIGKLMVISDIKNTPIQSINASSKKMDTAMTTNISNARGIEMDGQGNYYITSWSDNYVYQINKYFTKATKMFLYNKPAKLWFDANTDLLNFTCFGCGKLEKINIHNFAPDYNVEICKEDSFTIYLNTFIKNWGCFETNNTFTVQLSSITGNFNNPTNLVTIQDTAIPTLFKGKISGNLTAGNYKFRIVSSKPYVKSLLEKGFTIKPAPDGLAYSTDTAYFCKTDSLKLGATPLGQVANLKFNWTPSTNLSKDSIAFPYSKTQTPLKYKLKTTHKTTGCSYTDSVMVIPLSIPPSNFKDTVHLCKGEAINIGVKDDPAFDYSWSPADKLNDSTVSNPITNVKSSTWFHVEVGSGTCSVKDSVFVNVNDIPTLKGWKDTFWKCKETAIIIGANNDTTIEYNWAPPSGINNTKIFNPECFTQENRVYELGITDKNTKCKKVYRTQVIVYPSPTKPFVYKANDSTLSSSQFADSFVWYKDGLLISNSNSKELKVTVNAVYKVRTFNKNGCNAISENYEYKKNTSILDLLTLDGMNIYPIPLKQELNIKTRKEWKLMVFNLNGQTILKAQNKGPDQLDFSSIPKGIYTLQFSMDNKIYSVKVVK